jgi:hypothetical protein
VFRRIPRGYRRGQYCFLLGSNRSKNRLMQMEVVGSRASQSRFPFIGFADRSKHPDSPKQIHRADSSSVVLIQEIRAEPCWEVVSETPSAGYSGGVRAIGGPDRAMVGPSVIDRAAAANWGPRSSRAGSGCTPHRHAHHSTTSARAYVESWTNKIVNPLSWALRLKLWTILSR